MGRFVKGQVPWNKGIKCPRFTPEELKAKEQAYYQNRKDIADAQHKKWRKANPEKMNEYFKKYKQKHKARVNATNAKRHADKLKRTPSWLTKDDLWLIKEAYELAALRTKMFGFKWHVDHIVPLKGKRVSGLHIINNLQVIPGIENMKKNNIFEGCEVE